MNGHQGYSFIELLLALLIFSLGAMAIAAMQLNAAQATRGASNAAAALLLTEDLMQRMLANPGALAVYSQSLRGNAAGAGEVEACAVPEDCAGLAWARRDITAWRQAVGERLLTATRACVSRETAALRVSLSWAASTGPGDDEADAACGADGADPVAGWRGVTLSAPLEPLP